MIFDRIIKTLTYLLSPSGLEIDKLKVTLKFSEDFLEMDSSSRINVSMFHQQTSESLSSILERLHSRVVAGNKSLMDARVELLERKLQEPRQSAADHLALEIKLRRDLEIDPNLEEGDISAMEEN